jgi:hypothetical protein
LHVLGTPPAFVLSQDQTLHRESGFRNDQRPQQSWSRGNRPVASIRRAGSGWLPLPNWHRHESITGVMFPNLCIELLMGRPCRSKPSAGSPTLALWCVLSSVVKERTPPTGSGKVSAGTHRRPRGFGELVPACSPPVSVVTGSVGRRKTIGTCPARVNPRSGRGGGRAVHGAAARTDRGPDRPS